MTERHHTRPHYRSLFWLALLILLSGPAQPALADTATVTTAVEPEFEAAAGGPAATIANASLQSRSYSTATQNATATLVLTVNNSNGTNNGWNVTVMSSALDFAGGSYGDVPATSVAFTTIANPTRVNGQQINSTNGPLRVNGSANLSLNQPRKVITTRPDYGVGTYRQNLTYRVIYPAYARPGTYTATLTIDSSQGP